MMRSTPGVSKPTNNRRFWAMFAASPTVCGIIWRNLTTKLPKAADPKYLLWRLLFLKGYASEHVNSFIAWADEKTFRKWAWTFTDHIAAMSVWENRHQHSEGKVYKASVDGTEFMIYEPSPFNSKWYSHKFKGPGLRYEVGIGIGNGHILWEFGSFPCGEFNDLKFYRLGMKKCLFPGEKVVGDKVYRDFSCSSGSKRLEANAWKYFRARYEAVNKRIKQFMVMDRRFRHRLRLHSISFHAVCDVTQILIENGEPVFE